MEVLDDQVWTIVLNGGTDMLNKVMIIGNLGRDAVVKKTESGTVANFSVATTDRWKDKQTGERREKTEWHDVSVWGRVAETLGEYLVKGKQVYVEGSLTTRTWTDKDGEQKSRTEIKARDIRLLGGFPKLTEADIPF